MIILSVIPGGAYSAVGLSAAFIGTGLNSCIQACGTGAGSSTCTQNCYEQAAGQTIALASSTYIGVRFQSTLNAPIPGRRRFPESRRWWRG
jgi:hypothetical protein